MDNIFEELKGKRLLILGATMDDCQIVQARLMIHSIQLC